MLKTIIYLYLISFLSCSVFQMDNRVNKIENFNEAYKNNVDIFYYYNEKGSFKDDYYFSRPKEKYLKNEFKLPLFIIIHGHNNNKIGAAHYLYNNPILASLPAKYAISVLSLNQPGFGRNNFEKDYCGYKSINYFEETIQRFIDQKTNNIDKNNIFLLGESKGAICAALLADKIPNLKGVMLTGLFYDFKNFYENYEKFYEDKTIFEKIKLRIKNEMIIDQKNFDLRSPIKNISKKSYLIWDIHGEFDEYDPQMASNYLDKIRTNNNKSKLIIVKNQFHSLENEYLNYYIDQFLKAILK